MSNYHTPVLLKEVLEFLDVKQGELYIDATLGGGGYTFEILRRGGKVLGIDVDQEAIKFNELRFETGELRNEQRLKLVRGNFRDIDTIALKNEFNNVSGIVFDLGVSSRQLEEGERGFSFLKEGPLDMRMDRGLQVKARDLVNGLTKKELYELFTKYGEEPFAFAIATAIDKSRRVREISTTKDLSDIINRTIKVKKGINRATLVFQALRIAVNDELNSLAEAIPKAFGLLSDGGRIAVVSFHSLEDRIVKNEFLRLEKEGKGKILTKKPVVASPSEIEQNNRSRSAKLRVLEKL